MKENVYIPPPPPPQQPSNPLTIREKETWHWRKNKTACSLIE